MLTNNYLGFKFNLNYSKSHRHVMVNFQKSVTFGVAIEINKFLK